jgi:lipopolysaccharide biosynthesis protein
MNIDLTIPGLSRNWDFKASPVARWERRKAVETFFRAGHRRPAWCEIKALKPKSSWIVYFMYAPDGILSPSHRYTLSRLRDCGVPLLVVCACPDANRIPNDLPGFCDALFWKALPGYDFSAYTLALRQISRKSPGANVLVMNDSVFGPFADLRDMLVNSRWDLTGFTASSQLTNHIQSYAFCLRRVEPLTMLRLSPVFFPFAAISHPSAVILLQETRLARVAARSMKVGAFWFGDVRDIIDPTLVRPMELLDAGFPFLKRSLLGKHEAFIERDHMLARLERYGHPVDADMFGIAAHAGGIAPSHAGNPTLDVDEETLRTGSI